MIQASAKSSLKSLSGGESAKAARKIKSKNMRMRSEIHLSSLSKFYDDRKNFDALYEFCARKSKHHKQKKGRARLSRRILEFLCTKLAPKKPILLTSDTGETHDLHSRYQLFLNSAGKRFFDTFARNEKSKFDFVKHGRKVHTTIAQLRFFRFLIREGVLRYAQENVEEISKQMSAKRTKTSDDEAIDVSPRPRKRRRQTTTASTAQQNVKLSFAKHDDH